MFEQVLLREVNGDFIFEKFEIIQILKIILLKSNMKLKRAYFLMRIEIVNICCNLDSDL